MRHWTPYEEGFLLDNYESEGVKYCSDELQRSINSIVNKASRLGLAMTNPNARRTKSHREYEDELVEKDILYFPVEQYVTAKTPIEHECLYGHTWKVAPSRVLNRSASCPKCAAINFNPYKPCVLYLVSFIYNNTKYYILGLSTKEPKYKYLNHWVELSMELEWHTLYSSGLEAYNIQQEILKQSNIITLDIALSADNSIILDAPLNKPGE